MTWSAVYVDRDNVQWSCPITKNESGFVLRTANGVLPITFYIPDSSVAGGFLTFAGYRLDGANNLRGCDYIQQFDLMHRTLPLPVKPVDPPEPKVEVEDSRLHLPVRIGNEDSFSQLQRAYAEQVVSSERKTRTQMREDAQRSISPQILKQARQVREHHNEVASLMHKKVQGD